MITYSGPMIPAQTGVSRMPLKPLWSSPAQHLTGLVDEIANACPYAETTGVFDGAHYFRPAGHARSFYLRLEDSGVVAFKGTEPLSRDYRTVFEQAFHRRPVLDYSPMDHFVLREDEVYLAVTAPNAVSCAERSADWVRAYLDRFGELPNTPIPLLVLAIPSTVADEFSDTLMPYLTDRPQLSAQRRVSGLVDSGLAVYVYHFPSTPIRLAHARGEFPGAFGVGVDAAKRSNFNLDSAVRSWIELFARMLVVGYVPTTAVHAGHCLQSQNLAISGGFCDIDSIQPLESLGPRDLAAALVYSVTEFAEAVAGVIGLPAAWVAGLLWQEIQSAVLAEGGPCDERIHDVVELRGLDAVRWFAVAARSS